MGVALVRQENYPAALTAFQSLSEADRKIAPLVHYNQGNVLARLGQMLVSEDPQSAVELYNRSLAAFQRALSLDPGLRPAAYNLEVVRTWIAELLDSGSDEGGSGSQQNGASGNDGNERRNGTPSPGDSPGENPGGSQSPDAAPEQPSDQPPQPELSAPADNPWALRDETAQAILEEERRRREEEASWSGGDSSDGKPNW
jgi:tetratricopeptide (TPR) repeat protein